MSRLSLSGSILFSALAGVVTAVCWFLFTVTGYTQEGCTISNVQYNQIFVVFAKNIQILWAIKHS